MIRVQVNEQEVREIIQQQVAEALQKLDNDLVFWDAKELQRRTCMCWNTIQQHFFHDPRFPKAKVGAKWYFPAREAREFLEQWLKERIRRSTA